MDIWYGAREAVISSHSPFLFDPSLILSDVFRNLATKLYPRSIGGNIPNILSHFSPYLLPKVVWRWYQLPTSGVEKNGESKRKKQVRRDHSSISSSCCCLLAINHLIYRSHARAFPFENCCFSLWSSHFSTYTHTCAYTCMHKVHANTHSLISLTHFPPTCPCLPITSLSCCSSSFPQDPLHIRKSMWKFVVDDFGSITTGWMDLFAELRWWRLVSRL